MTTTYIAVCPHHCDSSFITEAEVTQKWEVDSYGECIRVRDEDVSTELPYTSSWKCSKCGAKAEEYQCARFEFKENGLNGFLLVPRDTLSVGYLFWDDQKSGVLRSLPIDCGVFLVPHAVVNGYTFWLLALGAVGASHDTICIGEDLDGVPLFLEYPRQECDGQMDFYSIA